MGVGARCWGQRALRASRCPPQFPPPAAGRRHGGAAAGTLTLQITCLGGDPSGRERRKVRAGAAGRFKLGTELPHPHPPRSERRPHRSPALLSRTPTSHTHTPRGARGTPGTSSELRGGRRAPCPALSRNPGTSAPRTAEAVRRREPCIIPGTAITAGSQSRERRGPALQRIDAGTGGDAQGWDVMPQHGRARLLRGSVAGWGRIQPGPRGAAAAEQPIRNRSADWGWRKGRPVSRRRRRADGWGLSAAAERPRTAHQSQAAAGRWEHYREHYKDHWAAPDPIGAPIPATAYSSRPRGGNPRHSCGPAAALGFPDLWAQRDEGGVALPTFYLGSRAALQRARVREGVQHHAAI